MKVDTDARNRLRATFDDVAQLYDQARPGYPEALYDDVIALSGIPPGGRILEIGCGTGQATLPLARRGYGILAVEMGAHLAAVARAKLAPYPRVAVHTGAFEEWPLEADAFDLAIAATAFHWIDPAVAFPKTAAALRPGGAIALFWNLHVRGETSQAFFDAVQEVYQREAPELIPPDYRPLPHPEDVPATVTAEIEHSGLFGPVAVRRYCWDQEYDAASYLRVLDTYSGHRSLSPEKRERLFRGIGELIDRGYNGRVTKAYLTMLYVAHLASPGAPRGVIQV
jgi:SAM-dependent methyltransferase